MEESGEKEEKATDEVGKSFLEKYIVVIFIVLIIIAAGCAVTAYYYYTHTFVGGISTDHQQWGALGDFFGGILNPVFSFFGLIALLLTIILQSKELRLSRIELENSNKELANSVRALNKNNEIADEQLSRNERIEIKKDLHLMADTIYQHLVVELKSEIGSNITVPNNTSMDTMLSLYLEAQRSSNGKVITDEFILSKFTYCLSKNNITRNHELDILTRDYVKKTLSISSSVEELKNYLSELDKFSINPETGKNVISRYYRRQLVTPILALNEIGLLDKEVLDYYDYSPLK